MKYFKIILLRIKLGPLIFWNWERKMLFWQTYLPMRFVARLSDIFFHFLKDLLGNVGQRDLRNCWVALFCEPKEKIPLAAHLLCLWPTNEVRILWILYNFLQFCTKKTLQYASFFHFRFMLFRWHWLGHFLFRFCKVC